jgi:hypothetical protein
MNSSKTFQGIPPERHRKREWLPFLSKSILLFMKAGVAFSAFLFMGWNSPVSNPPAPRPVAPQQLVESDVGLIAHTFSKGESIYKWAKCVICQYCAIVPQEKDVVDYIKEVVTVYNKTRLPNEIKIRNYDNIPACRIVFFPPSKLQNVREKQLGPVYRYFMSLTEDPCSYVTGDWCERGTGGGEPHYGIDVAANTGSRIMSPCEGTVVLHESPTAGRVTGIVKDGTILFFAHMDKRFVKNGQRVTIGQIIGTVGLTGNTSGPHYHIGYGIKSVDGDGLEIGRCFYKVTDPKMFFYREAYLGNFMK